MPFFWRQKTHKIIMSKQKANLNSETLRQRQHQHQQIAMEEPLIPQNEEPLNEEPLNEEPRNEESQNEESPNEESPNEESLNEEESLDTNQPMSSSQNPKYNALVGAFALFAIVVGYTVSVQPSGAGWRFFSWHPFLMILGFVAMMGTSAVTKKLGGYKNTKTHGILASSGLIMAFGGLYVIYRNKELMGKEHITSTHAIFGIITMAGCVMAAMAGGIFLHPDFGVDKTNKTIRYEKEFCVKFLFF